MCPNHVSLFQKATPVVSDSLPAPPLMNPDTPPHPHPGSAPSFSGDTVQPSTPVAVISTIHVPPQRALRNTPQVEVVELCQNENHLEKGKGGREKDRKGKEEKKKVAVRFCNGTQGI